MEKSGDWNAVAEAYLRAVALFEAEKNAARAGDSAFRGGLACENLQDYPRALDFYEKSLRLRREAGDAKRIAYAENAIGLVLERQGRYAEALPRFKSAQAVMLALDGRMHEDTAQTYLNLASLYRAMGDYPSALSAVHECLDIRRALKDKGGSAQALIELGLIYWSMGDFDGALSVNLEGLALMRETGDAFGIAAMTNNIGNLHHERQRYLEACRYYEEAVEWLKKSNELRHLPIILNNIASTHYRTGDYAGAHRRYGEALSMAEESGETAIVMLALGNLCINLADWGKPEEALPYGERAAAMAQASGSSERLFDSHLYMGRTLALLGRNEEAREHFHASLAVVESTRAVLEGAQKAGFLGMKLLAYEWFVRALVAASPPSSGLSSAPSKEKKTEDGAEAFAVSERMKARAFLDELGSARLSREGAPAELMERKRELEARMQWLRERGD